MLALRHGSPPESLTWRKSSCGAQHWRATSRDRLLSSSPLHDDDDDASECADILSAECATTSDDHLQLTATAKPPQTESAPQTETAPTTSTAAVEKNNQQVGNTSEQLQKTSEQLQKTSEQVEKTSEQVEKTSEQPVLSKSAAVLSKSAAVVASVRAVLPAALTVSARPPSPLRDVHVRRFSRHPSSSSCSSNSACSSATARPSKGSTSLYHSLTRSAKTVCQSSHVAVCSSRTSSFAHHKTSCRSTSTSTSAQSWECVQERAPDKHSSWRTVTRSLKTTTSHTSATQPRRWARSHHPFLVFRLSALLLALLLLSFSHRVRGERAHLLGGRASSSWRMHGQHHSASRSAATTSIHTVLSQHPRQSSADHVMREGEQPANSERPGFGVASMQGRRSYMEDYYAASSADGVSLFGVFDGHGGWEAAAYAQDQLFANVLSDVYAQSEAASSGGGKRDMAHAFDAGFARTERNLLADLPHSTAGSTAVCVSLVGAHLTAANLGDSRAVLGRRDGSAQPLSRDHKPDLPDERARIEALGGFVRRLGVWRVQGVLATSRALGDQPLKPFVSALPEQMERTLVAGVDDFVVLASDGLFDVLTNQEVVSLVRTRLAALSSKQQQQQQQQQQSTSTSADPRDWERAHAEELSHIAEELCKTAYQRGSSDNITAMIVDLRSYLERIDQQAWMSIKSRSV
eukprot:CAMPEP_0177648052 /NCGR_PEP_ID=MMETSP0447-20121125/10625_1 /TAXON_ID=0 /ORGANISM="Stygamoeba regulata, Strain BSH-02190019" /LENGTH=688 /DNA_ID=CAMNT_0019150673 /DNA_START=164 /DNA_END=2230 /DNA_ORIENTATION=+